MLASFDHHQHQQARLFGWREAHEPGVRVGVLVLGRAGLGRDWQLFIPKRVVRGAHRGAGHALHAIQDGGQGSRAELQRFDGLRWLVGKQLRRQQSAAATQHRIRVGHLERSRKQVPLADRQVDAVA